MICSVRHMGILYFTEPATGASLHRQTTARYLPHRGGHSPVRSPMDAERFPLTNHIAQHGLATRRDVHRHRGLDLAPSSGERLRQIAKLKIQLVEPVLRRQCQSRAHAGRGFLPVVAREGECDVE